MKAMINKKRRSVDLSEIFMNLHDQYEEVYSHQIDSEIFFFKPLGRKDYKDIATNDRLSNSEKEEIICQVCLLYPENYDFEECDAGTPSVLSDAILEKSLINSLESRLNVSNYYREEMFLLENQITCIINEAFPSIPIEEIENWSIDKTSKYISMAEWKLVNLRGMSADMDINRLISEEIENRKSGNEEINAEIPEETEEENKTNIRGGKKKKLTPEEIESLRKLQEISPGIDWTNDSVMQQGDDAFDGSFDTTAPALRTITD